MSLEKLFQCIIDNQVLTPAAAALLYMSVLLRKVNGMQLSMGQMLFLPYHNHKGKNQSNLVFIWADLVIQLHCLYRVTVTPLLSFIITVLQELW